MKKTNVRLKSNELIAILDSQFKGKLNLARIKFIALFISSLCKVQTVNFEKLANAFDSGSKAYFFAKKSSKIYIRFYTGI